MSGDHLERLEAALKGAHRVHHALGEPHPSMVLVDEPDLRAALDELKQLRAEREAVEVVRDWIADLDDEAQVEFKVRRLRAVLDRLRRLERERTEDVAAARRERDQFKHKLDDANAALWLFVSRYGNQTFYERDIVRAGELKAAVHAAAEERAALAAREAKGGE